MHTSLKSSSREPTIVTPLPRCDSLWADDVKLPLQSELAKLEVLLKALLGARSCTKRMGQELR